MDKHNRNRLIATGNILMVAGGEGVGRLWGRGEGMEEYKSVATEWSRGCKVQHREYSQFKKRKGV